MTGTWNPSAPNVPDSGTINLSYTLVSNGCSTTKSFSIKIGNVFLDAGPDKNICFGDTIVLKAIQPANAALVWQGPQIYSDSLFIGNNDEIMSAMVGFSYTQNGCTGSDSLRVNIHPLPDFAVLPQNVSFCQACDGGANVEISSPGQFQTIWSEYPSNNVIGTDSSIHNRCPGVISVQVVSLATGCDLSKIFEISNPANIDSSITQTACGSFNWNGQNYFSSGTYTFSNGCDFDTLNLTINPDPQVNLNLPDTVQILSGETLIITAGPLSQNYSWFRNEIPITGVTGPSFTVISGGMYLVISQIGSCTSSDSVFIKIISSKKPISAIQFPTIRAIPNPSCGVYQLEIENLRGTARIEVLDALGKLVYEGELSSQGIRTHQQLDIRHVAMGIYTLRLQTSDGPKYLRLKRE
jgi:hypothetical protein